MAAGARRQHAVEHVDAARDRFEDVVGRADAHQVARAVGRQLRHHRLEHVEHHRLRLADREPADGVAVEADAGERAGARGAQAAVVAALHDAEQRPAAGCGPPKAACERSAQRSDRLIARSISARGAAGATHSSSCIGMSEPSSVWISIDALRREHDASRRR